MNLALENLLPSQETSIEMIIPFETLSQNEKFLIKLLLKNVKTIKAPLFFKKQSTCLCNDRRRPSQSEAKPNLKNGCQYCYRDQACTINPTKMTLMVRFVHLIF